MTTMTVVWLGVLLAVVVPAWAKGSLLAIGEAGTPAAQLLAAAVLTLPATLVAAMILSWWCYGRRWERWAFYCSLLPVLNVLVAGLAWVWAMPTR
ncbi:MAG: hypothetical protein Q6J44_07220 [Gloeomargarita sp. DG02_4_bins_56]